MTKQTPEGAVKNACYQYMTHKRIFYWQINNKGYFHPVRKVFIKPPNFTPGVSDCMALINGTLYAIEFKAAGKGQSKGQNEFQARIEAHGGKYLVVRSVDDLQSAGI